MEVSRCDLALRQAAAPTSRRAALAALLGSALMLHEPAASEAKKKAKRRRTRRRKQRRKQRRNNAAALLKPISFEVFNTTDQTFSVEYGDSYPLKRCHVMKSIMLSRGTSGLLNTTIYNGFLWIAGKYWIDVWNSPLYPPQVAVAVNGQAPSDSFDCQDAGQILHRAIRMDEGDYLRFSFDGLDFMLFRGHDTNYKVYWLHVSRTP